MDPKRALFLGILLLIVLWLLHPSRQLQLDASMTDSRVVEISYMGPGGPLAGTLGDIIQQFEAQSEELHRKDPSRPIYRVISGQNAARDQVADPTRFLVGLAGGMPPDVIEFDRFAIAEWAARNAFTPLDDFINKDIAAGRTDSPRPDKFYPAAWNEAQYKGRVYGIPRGIDSRAMVVNKALLRRAGLVDTQGQAVIPRSWEQVREYNRKLTMVRFQGRDLSLEQYFQETGNTRLKDDATLISIGFLPLWGNSWLYFYGWMNGGEFVSADGTHITLNDPRIVEALTWLKEVYDEMGGFGRVQGFQAGFQGGALDPFVTGKVAMFINGIWYMNDLGRFAKEIDFEVVPPPMPQWQLDKGNDKLTWVGGWAFAIPATARNKEAAWELIRYLTSEPVIKRIVEAEHQLAQAEGRLFMPSQSPNKAINQWQRQTFIEENPALPEKFKKSVAIFNELLPFARYRPNTPVGQQLWQQHVSRTEQALYGQGGVTPQSALDEGTAIVQRELDRFIHPPQGIKIESWWWLVGVYAGLLILTGILVYLWDTHHTFRWRVGAMLGMSRKSREAVIDGSGGSYMRRYWLGGIICASPWLLGFIIFGGGPMLFSLVLSFCRYDIVNPAEFVGLANYAYLAKDERIPISLLNTLFMVIAVPLGMAGGLAIAMLLNQGVRWLSFWRTVFYLPAVIPAVVMAVIWAWLLNPNIGLINQLLSYVGISGPLWLQSTDWAKPALILMGLWGVGGGMIIWLAGLKSIPDTLYEAAAVDGAGPLSQFFNVTLPQLTPYIFFNLIMGLIGTFQIFEQAFIMTGGGPVDATLFYVYHLFNNAFRYGQMGYASSMAWVLFIIVLILTIVQIKGSKRWVHYESD